MWGFLAIHKVSVVKEQMAHKTFDLTGLSERLFSEGRFKSLAGKIRRAQDLASLHTDLTIALESMDALVASMETPPQDDLNGAVTEFALLCNAVVHYARATKTTSTERGGFDLRPRFTEEQKLVHKELIDLRDKAIAHFGSGGSYQGLWHFEVMILQAAENGVRAGVTTRRQTRDRKLVLRARAQIEITKNLMSEISTRKIDEVTAELNTFAPDGLEAELLPHTINLDDLMLSAEVGEEIRSSARSGGYKKGVLKHDG